MVEYVGKKTDESQMKEVVNGMKKAPGDRCPDLF
ncbi:hypothetical protein C8P63_101300 [Melghirimyces profundicolus]|uniref:Uncharacterized protein n=1 Tax=Melghirimyces profundicolus TaxID=1242148 RepID=A0A2T6C9T0_9BACL|nr:hypothetical protein C8P63_101300 [Melghirimyces profundicolus]